MSEAVQGTVASVHANVVDTRFDEHLPPIGSELRMEEADHPICKP